VSGLEWRPPARRGDFERAAHEEPSAIGLIDGYFETTLSVWHEEILLALDAGIPVYGAASIGALRGAELADFGMIGVGRVYDDFLSGALQDDDEVAVLHGPAEVDFLPLSDAMVNIRATLARAARRGVLSPETTAQIADAAKALFFKQRTFEAAIQSVLRHGAPQAEVLAFVRALPEVRVDQKRCDAQLLIDQILTTHHPRLRGAP
jgi:hypothetical protein